MEEKTGSTAQNFTFMIDDSNAMKTEATIGTEEGEEEHVRPLTVYQYLKQRNFASDMFGSKRVTVRVVDRLDHSQRILKSKDNVSSQGHHVFEAINFDPLSLAEVELLNEDEQKHLYADPSQEPKFSFTVYGRTDMRIFGVPEGHKVEMSASGLN